MQSPEGLEDSPLNFSTKDPPKKPIRETYYFFRGVFSTKI